LDTEPAAYAPAMAGGLLLRLEAFECRSRLRRRNRLGSTAGKFFEQRNGFRRLEAFQHLDGSQGSELIARHDVLANLLDKFCGAIAYLSRIAFVCRFPQRRDSEFGQLMELFAGALPNRELLIVKVGDELGDDRSVWPRSRLDA